MKKIIIVAVGKVKERYLADGINEYLKRLSGFCSIEIKEVADKEHKSKEENIAAQSGLILQQIKGFCILLDLRGELLSSEQLSQKIEKAYACGFDTVTFVIGGSDGVDERVKNAAQLALSFGRMTMPHQLARLVLTEQIYRAFSISKNTPYHK